MNRLKKVTDARGGITEFTYDPNSNLRTVKDARNNITEYTYDNMDRLATRKDPLLIQESYLYDPNGNLRQFTDRRGQITLFDYDALNRRRTVTYQDTSSTTYNYDAGNRLTGIADSISGTITRDYDGLDRLKFEITPQGRVDYTYDNANRRQTMTVFGQPQVNYTYDDINRAKQITQGTSTVAIGYDDASRRTSLTLPNGVLVEYGYDRASRVTGINYKLGAAVLGNLTYTYDAAGNKTQIGGTFARTGLPAAVTAGPYDAANRTYSFGGQAITYDENGNVRSFGPDTYNWNARNQLGSIAGGTTASFVYDGLGRRQKKTIGAAPTEFLYDRFNPVQEKDGATVLANILTGLGIDEFFTRSIPADPTATRHFLGDALGSTVALTNDAAAVQTEYTYEPFGKTTATGVASTNPFQFTGRENDGTGLYYYRARYYHPIFQRFISEDRLQYHRRSGKNLYAYVRNNPLRYRDPLGLTEDDGGGPGGGASDGGGSGGMGGRKDAPPPDPPDPEPPDPSPEPTAEGPKFEQGNPPWAGPRPRPGVDPDLEDNPINNAACLFYFGTGTGSYQGGACFGGRWFPPTGFPWTGPSRTPGPADPSQNM